MTGKWYRSKMARLFVVLLIPVILVTVLVQNSFSRLRIETLAEMNAAFAANAKTNTATINDILLNYAMSIYYSNEVKALRSETQPDNLKVIQGIRTMNNLTAVYAFIESVYIYNGVRQYIYSTSDWLDTNDTAERFGDRAAVDIFQNLEEYPALTPFYRVAEYGSPRGSKPVYSYLISDQNNESAMMINLSSKWLNDLILGNEMQACLMDADGELLASQMEISEEECKKVAQLLETQEASSGYVLYNFPGRTLRVCFFADMGSGGWRYLRLMDYADCIGGQMKAQRVAYGFILAVLITACLLALILMFRVVFPFRKLNMVMKDAGLAPEGNSHIEEMTEKLNRLVSLSGRAEHIEAAFNDMLRNETLYNMMTGSIEAEDGLKQYALHVDVYRPVSWFYIDGVNVKRYMNTLPAGIKGAEGISISNRHCVLLVQTEETISSRTVAEALMLSRPRGLVIYGEVTENPNQFPQAYHRLVRMYGRRCFYPGQRLLNTEILSELSGNTQDLNANEYKLISALKNGNSTAGKEYLQQMFDLLVMKKYHTAMAHLGSIYRTLMTLEQETGGEGAAVSDENAAAFEALLTDPDNLDEIKKSMEEAVHRIASSARQAKAVQHETLMRQIMDYISRAYTDPNLNSQMLADHFGISSAYLCRIFRKANNRSLGSYITEQRIRRSCELLRSTEKSVKEISTAVGLDNSQYFYVLFKQQTGMTPNEYRSNSENAAVLF